MTACTIAAQHAAAYQYFMTNQQAHINAYAAPGRGESTQYDKQHIAPQQSTGIRPPAKLMNLNDEHCISPSLNVS
jgi:hypothetical protein